MPEALNFVWLAFVDLAGTREVGMAMGPISFREIEAYQGQTHSCLTAWEVKLIRRLDTAVRAAMNTTAAPQGVSLKDTDGLKALFKSMAARMPRRDGSA